MRRKHTAGVAVLLAAGLVGALPAAAAPGDLDPTFGRDGVAVVDDDGRVYRANDGAILADDKIVLVGDAEQADGAIDLRVVRLNANGSPDTTFGDAGVVTTDIETEADETFNGVVVQRDGKLVAVGRTGAANRAQPVVVRYNADGTLDETFSTDGIVTTLTGGRSGEYADVALQSDGSIIAAGFVRQHNGDIRILVTRLTTGGVIDTTFSGGNKQVTLVGESTAQGVAIQDDDAVVLVATDSSGLDNHIAAVRLTADGEEDPTFDDDGFVVFEQLVSVGGAVAVQPDGKIVLAGTSETEAQEDLLLLRLDTDGAPDGDFGAGGEVITDVDRDDAGEAVAVQSDGRIIVAGTVDGQFGGVRYLANGDLDLPFGDRGVAIAPTDFGVATFVGSQSTGRLVFTGFGSELDGETQSFLAARFADRPQSRCGGEVVTVDLRLGDEPTQGADVIRGTTDDDVINGLGGEDIMCGLGGDDVMSGGSGSDDLIGGTGADRMRGGPGADQMRGGTGADTMAGGGGRDGCRGGAGQDAMTGCER